MVFAFVRRLWDPVRVAEQSTVELACGGRVALRIERGQAVLAMTTAPDAAGRSHVATVSLSPAEQAELSQALAPSASPARC
jgi:hypothetical protein